MADAGNGPEKHKRATNDTMPAKRTRRARIYGSLKGIVSKLLTGDTSQTTQPEAAIADPKPTKRADPTPAPVVHALGKPTPPIAQGATAQATVAAAEKPADAPPASDLVAKLQKATAGLTFISETDAPVEVFVWSDTASFTPEGLRAHQSVKAAEPVATEDIDHFFRNVTTSYDWHEDAEKEQVRRFIALRDLLKAELTDTTVYRFGTTAIEVYVVGRAADGTTLGIHTNVVET